MNREMYNDVAVKEALRPVVQAPSAVNGVTCDTRGYDSIVAVLTVGAIVNAGTLAVKFQHGDLSDMSDAADVAAADLLGAFPAVALQNSVVKVGYRGSKRYVRLVATEAVATSTVANAASFVLGKGSILPPE